MGMTALQREKMAAAGTAVDPALLPESQIRPWVTDEAANEEFEKLLESMEHTLSLTSPIKVLQGASEIDKVLHGDTRVDKFLEAMAKLAETEDWTSKFDRPRMAPEAVNGKLCCLYTQAKLNSDYWEMLGKEGGPDYPPWALEEARAAIERARQKQESEEMKEKEEKEVEEDGEGGAEGEVEVDKGGEESEEGCLGTSLAEDPEVAELLQQLVIQERPESDATLPADGPTGEAREQEQEQQQQEMVIQEQEAPSQSFDISRMKLDAGRAEHGPGLHGPGPRSCAGSDMSQLSQTSQLSRVSRLTGKSAITKRLQRERRKERERRQEQERANAPTEASLLGEAAGAGGSSTGIVELNKRIQAVKDKQDKGGLTIKYRKQTPTVRRARWMPRDPGILEELERERFIRESEAMEEIGGGVGQRQGQGLTVGISVSGGVPSSARGRPGGANDAERGDVEAWARQQQQLVIQQPPLGNNDASQDLPSDRRTTLGDSVTRASTVGSGTGRDSRRERRLPSMRARSPSSPLQHRPSSCGEQEEQGQGHGLSQSASMPNLGSSVGGPKRVGQKSVAQTIRGLDRRGVNPHNVLGKACAASNAVNALPQDELFLKARLLISGMKKKNTVDHTWDILDNTKGFTEKMKEEDCWTTEATRSLGVANTQVFDEERRCNPLLPEYCIKQSDARKWGEEAIKCKVPLYVSGSMRIKPGKT